MKKGLEKIWIETRKTLREQKTLSLAFSWLKHHADNML